jgi:hypothetical protein
MIEFEGITIIVWIGVHIKIDTNNNIMMFFSLVLTLKLTWHDGPVSYLGPAFKLQELSRWLNRRPSVEIFCNRKEKKSV